MGYSPHDANVGHGYGRAAKARGLGQEFELADDFPYPSADPYADLEDEPDRDPFDALQTRKLGSPNYLSHDAAGMWNATDRISASSLRNGVLEAGIVPIPGLYDNIDTGTPVGGTGTISHQSPWTGSRRAAAGYNPLPIDDEMQNFDLSDIMSDDDIRAVRRVKQEHDELVSEFRLFAKFLSL